MCDWYVLDADGEPVLEPDILKAAMQFSFGRRLSRSVAREYIGGSVMVSTVFLGLDHGYGDGPPVLWETMIFGGDHDGYQDRYISKADALAGHIAARRLVTGVEHDAT